MHFPILMVWMLLTTGSQPLDECPCFAEGQRPIYKGCDPGTIYSDYLECSTAAFFKDIYANLHYPDEAAKLGLQGTVIISFDVLEDGTMAHFEVKRDDQGHGLGEAALEAVKGLSSKGFCPARGEACAPVVYKMTVPVGFKLK